MRTSFAALLSLSIIAGCGMGNSAMVKGAGPGELLKLRAGPGLNYKILLGLPNGTQVKRHECVTEVGQLWCKVSLTATPGVSGYVSADYLALPDL